MIKQASIKDIDQLSQLFDQYRIFYRKPSNIEQAKIFLKERMERNESTIYVANNNEGNLVGFVQLYPLFSSTRMQRYWLLNDLFVAQDHRRKGFSIALIEAAKDLCKSSHAAGMFLETEKSNIEGNQLYPKVGFQLDKDHHYYFWDC